MAQDFPPHAQGSGYSHSSQPAQPAGTGPNGAQAAGGLKPKLGLAQWSGAAISVALIVGLGVWGYRLMVRDVSGVPVIKALEGEARSAPENPGGQLAVHQGLSVNTVTADGSAAAPADRLVLAPRSVELSAEDQPMGETLSVPLEFMPEGTAADREAAQATQNSVAEAQDTEPASVLEDVLERSLDVVEPAETVGLEGALEPVPTEINDVAPDPIQSAGAQIKSRPTARPAVKPKPVQSTQDTASEVDLDAVAGDILAALTSQDQPQPESAQTELSPSDIPTGTRLVQLGAFASEAVARQEWVRLAGRFDEFMDGKTRVIERAEIGDKVLYRLRAHGFENSAQSNRFCAGLTARGAACVPVSQR